MALTMAASFLSSRVQCFSESGVATDICDGPRLVVWVLLFKREHQSRRCGFEPHVEGAGAVGGDIPVRGDQYGRGGHT